MARRPLRRAGSMTAQRLRPPPCFPLTRHRPRSRSTNWGAAGTSGSRNSVSPAQPPRNRPSADRTDARWRDAGSGGASGFPAHRHRRWPATVPHSCAPAVAAQAELLPDRRGVPGHRRPRRPRRHGDVRRFELDSTRPRAIGPAGSRRIPHIRRSRGRRAGPAHGTGHRAARPGYGSTLRADEGEQEPSLPSQEAGEELLRAIVARRGQ